MMLQYVVRNKDELYHEGILGMHWGKRNGPPYPLRAQQLSAEEKRLSKRQLKKEIKRSKKEEYYKAMTDDELKSHIERLKMENEYRNLSGLQIKTGQKSTVSYLQEGGKEGLKEVAKKAVTTLGGNVFNSIASDSKTRDDLRDRATKDKYEKEKKAKEEIADKVKKSKQFDANKELGKYRGNIKQLEERVSSGKYTSEQVEALNKAYKSQNEFGKHVNNQWKYAVTDNKNSTREYFDNDKSLTEEEKRILEAYRKRND